MKKVLIVEDEKFIQDLYSLVFTTSGFDVDTASDGDEALTKIKEHTYDIILLDIMLPKTNGIEVLRTIRKEDAPSKDIPVFLITNLGQENIIKEAFDIGADGYLLKSQVTPKDAVATINTYLEKKASLHP
jgi:DNA-binding response OmpR family regulator